MKRSELLFHALLVPVDYLMLVAAGVVVYLLRTSEFGRAMVGPVLFGPRLPLEKFFALVLGVAVIWLIAFALVGLYRPEVTRRPIEEFSKVVIASTAGIMAVIFYIFFSSQLFDSRFLILAGWALGVVTVTLGRFLMRVLWRFLVVRYHMGVHKILVIGRDEVSRGVVEAISEDPACGYHIAAHLAEPDLVAIDRAIGNPGVDELILTDPDWPRERVLELIDFAVERRLAFKFVPNLFQTLTTNAAVETVAGVPVVELKRSRLEGWGRIAKRLIDIVGAAFGLVLFAPVMAAIALAIKLDSGGPVIYRNRRVGPRGAFETLKFRTMKLEYCTDERYPQWRWAREFEAKLVAERSQRRGPVFKVMDDPRRTPVGRFLERTSLDELPQFVNVLRGHMALVGPRPHMPREVERYGTHHRLVFFVKPGLTGLAQISGRSDLDFEDEVKLDIYYMEHWSLKLDFAILFKTPFVIFFRRHRN
ncbi:sugar transferase [Candidatus Parcubacteria bacterium]|nr:sugar transferase [Candidatus Parcubacteria bacterium]